MQMDKVSGLQEYYDPNDDISSQIKKKYDFREHSPTKRLDNCGHKIYRVWFNFPPKETNSIESAVCLNFKLFIKLRVYFKDEESCEEFTLAAYPSYRLKNLVNIAFGPEVGRKTQVRESLFCG